MLAKFRMLRHEGGEFFVHPAPPAAQHQRRQPLSQQRQEPVPDLEQQDVVLAIRKLGSACVSGMAGDKVAPPSNKMLFMDMVPQGGAWKVDYGRTQPSSAAGRPAPRAGRRRRCGRPSRARATATPRPPSWARNSTSSPGFFDRCLTGKAENFWRGLAGLPESATPDWWTGDYDELVTAFESFSPPDEATLVHAGYTDEGTDQKRSLIGYRLHIRLVNGTWKLEDATFLVDGTSMFQRRTQ